jgi:hypothetical protein
MRFYDSLFILKRSYENVLDMGELMWDYQLTSAEIISQDHKRSVHYLTLFNHSLLEVCSFLEEYDKYFHSTSEEPFKKRIREFRKAASPAMEKVREWKDLRTYRNEMIAHPWRMGEENQLSYKKLLVYDVPKSYMQLQLCRLYLGIIIRLMDLEFEKELIAMSSHIMKMGHDWMPQKGFATPYEDMEAAIAEINQILQRQQKSYAIDPQQFLGSMKDINPNQM